MRIPGQLLPAASAFIFAISSPTVLILIGMRVLILPQRKRFLSTHFELPANRGHSSVELNIAIICSSMPACSSLAKHVFEGYNVLSSVRSLFDRHLLSSRTKNSSKKSKSSYDASYPAGVAQNKHSMDSRAPLSENEYMELREAKPYMRTSEINGTDCYHQKNPSPVYQPGITRTIEVDIA